ncbi:hypothetical protein [Mariprofundus aestuarium]|nr:hypothetical protein [Mariprofundus aestuarium]
MQISCPQCHKTYNIEAQIKLESVTCSQCGSEFSPDAVEEKTSEAPSQPDGIEVLEQPEFSPPPRKTASIWPWLFTLLILITSAGIWTQRDAWLDNRWMRGILLGFNLPLENRAKDWLIVPKSVRIEWITRDDNSRVMLISGTINNLLASRMPYPDIEVTFYSSLQPDLVLESRSFPLTEKTDAKNFAHAPLALPEPMKSAAGHSSTEFVIINEAVAAGVGDITLTPRIR